ncbi:MAG: hypothetical protein M1542_03615, partial [Thermotogae bacterium]|nr:hypothetical protein [Thermotogota bacterium]
LTFSQNSSDNFHDFMLFSSACFIFHHPKQFYNIFHHLFKDKLLVYLCYHLLSNCDMLPPLIEGGEFLLKKVKLQKENLSNNFFNSEKFALDGFLENCQLRIYLVYNSNEKLQKKR